MAGECLRQVRPICPGAPGSDPFPEIDGVSGEVRRLKREMWTVARDPHVTVLLVGESGTGKERIARAIHRASPRSTAPFVVIDCAGLSPTLAEDSLFGHTRGAFTGAVDDRPGPFERADGGTVLLDEVGELPLDLQMKLLRALQARTVQRLGSARETAFEARIIAATNIDLAAARRHGRFREDLYYRLKVFEIRVPSLRHRGSADIRALASTIVQRFADRRQLPAPFIDSAALDVLVRHDWPGNVRELENALERMLVAAAGAPLLSRMHLPDEIRHATPGAESIGSGPPDAARLAAALERNDFKRARTAADLGLSRHQLYRLVKRRGIPPREGDP